MPLVCADLGATDEACDWLIQNLPLCPERPLSALPVLPDQLRWDGPRLSHGGLCPLALSSSQEIEKNIRYTKYNCLRDITELAFCCGYWRKIYPKELLIKNAGTKSQISSRDKENRVCQRKYLVHLTLFDTGTSVLIIMKKKMSCGHT